MTKKEWEKVILIALLSWIIYALGVYLIIASAFSYPPHSNINSYISFGFIFVAIYFFLMCFILKDYSWPQKLKIWFYGLLACIAFIAFTFVTLC